VKKGNKVVKKELIVALKGELYFVKFSINQEEDDVEPRVILGRPFMRLAKGIVDFDNGVITIYPELDPFEDDSEKEVKSPDDWDQLLDFNFDNVPNGNNHHWQWKLILAEGTLNLAVGMPCAFYSQQFGEELPSLVYKVKLDGKIIKEEEEAVERIKDINTMPYRIYETLGREELKKVDRGITMINHTQVGAIRIVTNVLCQVRVTTIIAKFIILDIPIDRDAPIVTMGTHDDEAGSLRSKRSRQHETMEEVLLPQVYHEFLLWEVNWDVLNTMGWDVEIDDMLRIRLQEVGSDEEIFTSVAWIRAFNINELIYTKLFHEFYSTYEFDEVCADDELQTKKIIKHQNGYANVAWLIARSLSAPVYCRDLDMTTLRELFDSESRLIPEDPQPGVPRVCIPRPPRASMQDLYDRTGRIEIRQEGAYNPPGYQPQYD
nr:hypothetical protein [Tanacetum cinerariifolium]